MTEIWKSILTFPNYEVSNLGRVKSLPRKIHCKHGAIKTYQGRILSPCPDKNGYHRACMGRANWRYIHRLVLEAFVGPCPSGMEGCHNDGNPQNNRLNNLRWDTQSGNERDKVLHKRDNRGERHYAAKLTEIEVRWIHNLYRDMNYTLTSLGKMFGVERGHIRNIVKKYTAWKHVT